MTNKYAGLSERLKRLGFAQRNKMKLYGVELELVSDPIFGENDETYVDAIEKRSRQVRRVHIPLNILQMANERTAA
jgi:hypothetical protein